MDQTLFKETVERLKAVDAVVKDLDPALRPEAVAILRPYITGDDPELDGAEGGRRDDEKKSKKPQGVSGLDIDALVEKHASDKDHENALLALGVYYGRHGKGPLALKDVKAIADDDLNLDVPARMDRTFQQMKRDGNFVMRKQADGTWKVTPSGEKFIRDTYGITKGRKAAPEA